MEKPNYNGGGSVNLLSSLVDALGGQPTGYEPLSLLSPRRLAGARNLVLMVIDGLGEHFLAGKPESRLASHRSGRISSVAPPTTAAAIPTFLTAAPPSEHGFTGWFSWFRELGCVAATLPFVTRGGHVSLNNGGLGPRDLAGAGPVFQRLPVSSHVVTPRHIAYSVFNKAFSAGAKIHPFEDMAGFFDSIQSLATQGRERCYIYAYWPEFDALAHEHGIASKEVDRHFDQLDAAFGQFVDGLSGSDTAVVVTADHGFVDVAPQNQIHLADHPELEACLTLPLCGEPRFAYCYVRPDSSRRFEEYVTLELGHAARCIPSRELLEQGWCGPGEPHPRLLERIGDYVLVMRDGWLIKDRMPGEREYRHIGVHGGLSVDEVYVPLIVVEA